MKYITLTDKRTNSPIEIPYDAPGIIFIEEGNYTHIKWPINNPEGTYTKTCIVKESIKELDEKIKSLNNNEIYSAK